MLPKVTLLKIMFGAFLMIGSVVAAPTTEISETSEDFVCPLFCICANSSLNEGTLEVDCSSTDQTGLPVILKKDRISFLDLSFNSIQTISNNTFIEYKELKTLIMSFSDVEIINREAFNGLGAIEEIDLSDNYISTINKDTFINLANLQTLSLSGNSLVDLDVNSPIINSLSLKYLDLSHCKISTLSATTFAGLPNLEILDLKSNSLRSISMDVFKPLEHLSYADLNFNPWSCTCEMKTIFDWVSSRSPSRDLLPPSLATAGPDASTDSFQLNRPIYCLHDSEFRKLWSAFDKLQPCFESVDYDTEAVTPELDSRKNILLAAIEREMLESSYDDDEETGIKEEPYYQEESLTIDRLYKKSTNALYDYSHVLYLLMLLCIIFVAVWVGTTTAKRYVYAHAVLKEKALENIKQREMKTFNIVGGEDNMTTASLLKPGNCGRDGNSPSITC